MPYIGTVTQANGYTLEVAAASTVTTSLTWLYIRKDRVSEVESVVQSGNLALQQRALASNVARVVLIAATQGGSALIRINGVQNEVGANPDANIVFDVV